MKKRGQIDPVSAVSLGTNEAIDSTNKKKGLWIFVIIAAVIILIIIVALFFILPKKTIQDDNSSNISQNSNNLSNQELNGEERTCSEKGGSLCVIPDCEGTIVNSSSGSNCCIGNCIEKDTCSNKGGQICPDNNKMCIGSVEITTDTNDCCIGTCKSCSSAVDCPSIMKCGNDELGRVICVFKTCTDIGGKVCNTGETCSVETKYTDIYGNNSYVDGCCTGQCKVNQTISEQKTLKPCIDSDGGKNIYVKGTISGSFINADGDLIDLNQNESCDIWGGYAHSCEANGTTYDGTPYVCKVWEYYCGNNGQTEYEEIECPNGCNDGACIQ